MPKKALSLLGMARRAGKITYQEDSNLAAIRNGQAQLLILAIDAGTAVAKKYRNKCLTYHVPIIENITKDDLGLALGTAPRAAVTILDEGFAKRFRELLTNE